MTRVEIEVTVEQIARAAARKHGLIEAAEQITLASELHYDLGMDELDIVEVLCRAEDRFGVVLPDNLDIHASCTLSYIVDLISERLSQTNVIGAQAVDNAHSQPSLGRDG